MDVRPSCLPMGTSMGSIESRRMDDSCPEEYLSEEDTHKFFAADWMVMSDGDYRRGMCDDQTLIATVEVLLEPGAHDRTGQSKSLWTDAHIAGTQSMRCPKDEVDQMHLHRV